MAGGRSARLRDLPRPAAEPDRAARALPRSQHRRAHARRPSTTPWRSSSKLRLIEARGRDRARPHGGDQVAHGVPAARRPGLSTARPLRAHACRAARRSASGSRRSSAPTCRACATCSTSPPSACIRATTACCSMRWPSWRRHRNTLVVVEHDEDTIRRADHVIDLGPGAGVRGGEVVGCRHRRGAQEESRVRHRPLPRDSRCCTRASRAAPRGTRARAAQARQHRAAQRSQGRHRHSRGPARGGHRRVGLGQVHGGARRAVHQPQAPGGQGPGTARAAPNYPSSSASRPCAASSSSTACSKSTRRRSARRRAPARPPTSASGTTSAGSSPTPPRRRSPATPPAASRSTRRAAAARPAKARACRPSR